jgi:hypothetical protein
VSARYKGKYLKVPFGSMKLSVLGQRFTATSSLRSSNVSLAVVNGNKFAVIVSAEGGVSGVGSGVAQRAETSGPAGESGGSEQQRSRLDAAQRAALLPPGARPWLRPHLPPPHPGRPRPQGPLTLRDNGVKTTGGRFEAFLVGPGSDWASTAGARVALYNK